MTGLANCVGFRTYLHVLSGKLIVPHLAGGFFFDPNELAENYGFITPNPTPDKDSVRMSACTKESFLNRFKTVKIHKINSILGGVDIPVMLSIVKNGFDRAKAIYQYFQSLDPFNNPVEKIEYLTGEGRKKGIEFI